MIMHKDQYKGSLEYYEEDRVIQPKDLWESCVKEAVSGEGLTTVQPPKNLDVMQDVLSDQELKRLLGTR